MEKIDNKLFNRILEEAEISPRLRMHYDLRTQATDSDPLWRDSSKRMQNVMMKGRMVLSSLKRKTGRMGKNVGIAGENVTFYVDYLED